MGATTIQDINKLCSLHLQLYGGFHLLIALIQTYFYLGFLSDPCVMGYWLWSSPS